MKKARTTINIILGSMIAALGLTSCEPRVKYGPNPEFEVLYGPAPVEDTTVHCMYGVTPVIISDLNEE